MKTLYFILLFCSCFNVLIGQNLDDPLTDYEKSLTEKERNKQIRNLKMEINRCKSNFQDCYHLEIRLMRLININEFLYVDSISEIINNTNSYNDLPKFKFKINSPFNIYNIGLNSEISTDYKKLPKDTTIYLFSVQNINQDTLPTKFDISILKTTSYHPSSIYLCFDPINRRYIRQLDFTIRQYYDENYKLLYHPLLETWIKKSISLFQIERNRRDSIQYFKKRSNPTVTNYSDFNALNAAFNHISSHNYLTQFSYFELNYAAYRLQEFMSQKMGMQLNEEQPFSMKEPNMYIKYIFHKPMLINESKKEITFCFNLFVYNDGLFIKSCKITGDFETVLNFFVTYWDTKLNFENTKNNGVAYVYLWQDKISLEYSPKVEAIITIKNTTIQSENDFKINYSKNWDKDQ